MVFSQTAYSGPCLQATIRLPDLPPAPPGEATQPSQTDCPLSPLSGYGPPTQVCYPPQWPLAMPFSDSEGQYVNKGSLPTKMERFRPFSSWSDQGVYVQAPPPQTPQERGVLRDRCISQASPSTWARECSKSPVERGAEVLEEGRQTKLWQHLDFPSCCQSWDDLLGEGGCSSPGSPTAAAAALSARWLVSSPRRASHRDPFSPLLSCCLGGQGSTPASQLWRLPERVLGGAGQHLTQLSLTPTGKLSPRVEMLSSRI